MKRSASISPRIIKRAGARLRGTIHKPVLAVAASICFSAMVVAASLYVALIAGRSLLPGPLPQAAALWPVASLPLEAQAPAVQTPPAPPAAPTGNARLLALQSGAPALVSRPAPAASPAAAAPAPAPVVAEQPAVPAQAADEKPIIDNAVSPAPTPAPETGSPAVIEFDESINGGQAGGSESNGPASSGCHRGGRSPEGTRMGGESHKQQESDAGARATAGARVSREED